MSAVVGVLAVALLFALFGLLRPRRGCDGQCDSCVGTGTCTYVESEHAQH